MLHGDGSSGVLLGVQYPDQRSEMCGTRCHTVLDIDGELIIAPDFAASLRNLEHGLVWPVLSFVSSSFPSLEVVVAQDPLPLASAASWNFTRALIHAARERILFQGDAVPRTLAFALRQGSQARSVRFGLATSLEKE